MALTTGLDLIQRLSELISDHRLLTATGGSASTIVDTGLADLTEDDGGIQGYVKIVTDQGGAGDAPEGEVRRIKNGIPGYTASSTQITVSFDFTAGVASGDIYEWHRFDPAVKRTAISRAIEQLYPILYLPITDESLIVDNLFSNSQFESAVDSNVSPSWTNVGTPTLTDETTIVRHGSRSLKIVASGAAEGIEQAPQVNIHELTGKTATAKFHVYATAANAARLRWDWDGTNFFSGTYHTGEDEWQLLTAVATIPDSATQLKLRLEVANGATAYFDTGYGAVGPLYRYTIPSTMITGPYRLYEQTDETNPAGTYDPILDAPSRGNILRMIGKGLLSRPTTDTATTEVDGASLNLIAAKAAEVLFMMLRGDPGEERHDPSFWRGEVYGTPGKPGLIDQTGAASPPLSSEMPNDAWHVERDSVTNTLVFTGMRG